MSGKLLQKNSELSSDNQLNDEALLAYSFLAPKKLISNNEKLDKVQLGSESKSRVER
jgi:hypothetical protein